MAPSRPHVRPPTTDDVREYATRLGLSLSDPEIETYTKLIASKLGVIRALDSLPDGETSPIAAVRDRGHPPDSAADPHNAFIRRCTVESSDDGPLSGMTVGVKDNIAVAGVELTAGTKALEGYVPSFDATVVTRLLKAGATVTGKTNLDELAVSGSGEPTATGVIRNPHSDSHLAGGSSGGSAVAVVNGDVDIALGTDQAGSLRTPASWCGCVGFKPTYGLVPYTGCLPGGPTYDHAGPITRTVSECADVLSVLAGPDGRDHRQPFDGPATVDPVPDDYTVFLEKPVSECSIGVIQEGFGLEHSEPIVDETVMEAMDAVADQGADIEEVSIPWHDHGVVIWLGVAWSESAALLRDNGQGYYTDGQYFTQYLRKMEEALETRSDEFAPTVKSKLLLGEYLRETYGGYYHAKAQNLRGRLCDAYDERLATYDVLALPTTPTTAFERREDLTTTELVERAQGKKGRTQNTMPFDMTGHPAITIPCGRDDDGLPIGLMLVGNRFDDGTVLAVADTLENEIAYDPSPPSH